MNKHKKKQLDSLLEDDITEKFTPLDMMSERNIRERLADYDITDDVGKLTQGQHIVYFEKLDNGKFKFKPGGFLAVNKSPDYIILTNGRSNWSVQLANHIIFSQHKSAQQISDCETKILKLEHKIDMYRVQVDGFEKTIEKLKRENEWLRSKIR